MANIIAVCTSDIKGIQKTRQHEVNVVADHGIEGDAHAGKWHRQVSLLSYDKIENFKERGADVEDGAFGENIIVAGIDLSALPVGTLLQSGDIRLEVTQIGKQCHQHCAIYHTVGDCIMPREGIFTKVLAGGILKKGDEVHVV